MRTRLEVGMRLVWWAALVVACIVGTVLLATRASAQTRDAPRASHDAGHHGAGGTHPELEAFVARALDATRPFRDRNEAIRAGYRKLGADFPGMGEHWVNPGLIVRGAVDPARPPVLSYVVIDGEPVLTGLAFTLPLAPDAEPPSEPFGAHAWHDHSGDVDEETLLLNHPASRHGGGSGYRLSMVHVWTDLENPDGLLAQNNWRLPWLRVGVEPPAGADREAARGVSLGFSGRDFYAELLEAAAPGMGPGEKAEVEEALDRWAGRVETLVEEARAPGAGPDAAAFREAWRGFWEEVRAGVTPATWAAVGGVGGG